mgnify:CR=1 FL=1
MNKPIQTPEVSRRSFVQSAAGLTFSFALSGAVNLHAPVRAALPYFPSLRARVDAGFLPTEAAPRESVRS